MSAISTIKRKHLERSRKNDRFSNKKARNGQIRRFTLERHGDVNQDQTISALNLDSEETTLAQRKEDKPRFRSFRTFDVFALT